MSAVAAPPAPLLPAGTTPPPPAAAAAPAEPYYLSMSTVRRFTLAEYHKMIETGVLIDGEPYELLEGHLVHKMSRGSPHDSAVQVLAKRLYRMVPDGWEVRPQCAVTLSDDSEPEPDIAVARGDETTFRDHHPGPTELSFVVEVSASSLSIDQHDKGRIYARDGIPVYWVVNVEDRRIEVYTRPGDTPDGPAYQDRQDFPTGSDVPVVLDGHQIGVVAAADLIG